VGLGNRATRQPVNLPEALWLALSASHLEGVALEEIPSECPARDPSEPPRAQVVLGSTLDFECAVAPTLWASVPAWLVATQSMTGPRIGVVTVGLVRCSPQFMMQAVLALKSTGQNVYPASHLCHTWSPESGQCASINN